jgi:uncharacterized protein YndB with AHSA1/START domain
MIEPIRTAVLIDCSPEHAFDVFTNAMSDWWPLEHHSLAVDAQGDLKAEGVVVEPRIAGRIYEVMSDGTEGNWGTILVWEPPRRLVIAWKPNTNANPPTEIEISFTREGEGTRVDLEHRGWERLGAIAEEAKADYGEGWGITLQRFSRAAHETAS